MTFFLQFIQNSYINLDNSVLLYSYVLRYSFIIVRNFDLDLNRVYMTPKVITSYHAHVKK